MMATPLAMASTARGSEIVKALAAKRAGNGDEANRIYDTQFVVAGPAYVNALKGVLDFQRKAIDNMSASDEATTGNHDLSARTEQQASALEQNADSARWANQLAQSAHRGGAGRRNRGPGGVHHDGYQRLVQENQDPDQRSA